MCVVLHYYFPLSGLLRNSFDRVRSHPIEHELNGKSKDNAECERFNQTLQTEFLDLGNFSPDPATQNRSLTEWLIEYNFRRPHATLNYNPPIQVTPKAKVLAMYPLCTFA